MYRKKNRLSKKKKHLLLLGIAKVRLPESNPDCHRCSSRNAVTNYVESFVQRTNQDFVVGKSLGDPGFLNGYEPVLVGMDPTSGPRAVRRHRRGDGPAQTVAGDPRERSAKVIILLAPDLVQLDFLVQAAGLYGFVPTVHSTEPWDGRHQ